MTSVCPDETGVGRDYLGWPNRLHYKRSLLLVRENLRGKIYSGSALVGSLS